MDVSSFSNYVFAPSYKRVSYFSPELKETKAMWVWRHTIGRISLLASGLILSAGLTLHLCKLAVEGVFVSLSAGKFTSILTFSDVKKNSEKLTTVAEEWKNGIGDWLIPTVDYPSFPSILLKELFNIFQTEINPSPLGTR